MRTRTRTTRFGRSLSLNRKRGVNSVARERRARRGRRARSATPSTRTSRRRADRDAAAARPAGTNTSTYGCARSASVTRGRAGRDHLAGLDVHVDDGAVGRARAARSARAARRSRRAPRAAACARASAAAISSLRAPLRSALGVARARAGARSVARSCGRHVVDRRARCAAPAACSCCLAREVLGQRLFLRRSAAISASLARRSSPRVPAAQQRSWACGAGELGRAQVALRQLERVVEPRPAAAPAATSWPRSTATSSTRPPSSKPITRSSYSTTPCSGGSSAARAVSQPTQPRASAERRQSQRHGVSYLSFVLIIN